MLECTICFYYLLQVGKLCQALKPCPMTLTCIGVCNCLGYECIETTSGNFKGKSIGRPNLIDRLGESKS